MFMHDNNAQSGNEGLTMRTWRFPMLRLVLASVAIIALLLVAASNARAGGAGAVSYTQTFKNVTETFHDVNPCSGAPATITITYNGVFHVTELTSRQGAGTFWATGTQTGNFTLVPDDPAQPTYTGHFMIWFGDNNNLQNGSETSTFTLHGTDSDSSTLRFHDTAHMSVSASGVSIMFDKPSCG
ncbi:MAG: hypothetical protein ACJ8CR_20845 [Roseiflexaceae bacterium]